MVAVLPADVWQAASEKNPISTEDVRDVPATAISTTPVCGAWTGITISVDTPCNDTDPCAGVTCVSKFVTVGGSSVAKVSASALAHGVMPDNSPAVKANANTPDTIDFMLFFMFSPPLSQYFQKQKAVKPKHSILRP
jgi:hypothetical protein